MDRKEFLRTLGLGSAALWATYCLGGCKGDEEPTPNELPADGLTLDLNTAQYSSLKNNGSHVTISDYKIVVARTTTGSYVAVTKVCTHEGQVRIEYIPSQNFFECGAHGAQFSITGQGLNENGKNGIRVYRTEINQAGDTLKIFNS
jgi:cytochrome b6-f complex iron-sulfur subunit